MSEQMNIPGSDLTGLQIDHSSPIPLHMQVELLLRELIEQDEYQGGKLLPKEVDLAKHLGISRNTVRQATNKLVHENLLTRKKGVGTKVAQKQVTTSLDHWFSFSQEMEDQGRELITYRIDTGWVAADADIARQLEIEEGRMVLKLERLKGQPHFTFLHFPIFIISILPFLPLLLPFLSASITFSAFRFPFFCLLLPYLSHHPTNLLFL